MSYWIHFRQCIDGAQITGDSINEFRARFSPTIRTHHVRVCNGIFNLLGAEDVGRFLTESKFNSITGININLCNSYNSFLVDSEAVTVQYPDVPSILKDLRLMGESNSLSLRSGGFSLENLARIQNLYDRDYKTEDGNLPLTFCIIYFMAWT